MAGNILITIKALKYPFSFQKNKRNCEINIKKNVAKYCPVNENICIRFSLTAREWEKLFHEKPVKIFPLKNSPIEIHDANDIILLIFVSQKIVGIIKLGDTNSNINNGSPKRVINLNGDNSGLNSNAEIIHENPNRK